jgi:hypothetical protein
MAEITYTASETKTANRARLVSIHIERDVDAAGAFTGEVVVGVKALVGFSDGVTFTPHRPVGFVVRRTLAQAVALFGGTVLNALEAKALELAQTQGELPAGTIT